MPTSIQMISELLKDTLYPKLWGAYSEYIGEF